MRMFDTLEEFLLAVAEGWTPNTLWNGLCSNAREHCFDIWTDRKLKRSFEALGYDSAFPLGAHEYDLLNTADNKYVGERGKRRRELAREVYMHLILCPEHSLNT